MPSSILDKKSETFRQSGNLDLFAPSPDGSPSQQLYARFRICRGFMDDLNRVLPIRVRIELESRVGGGESAGHVQTPQGLYRWEFHPD